MDVHTPETGDQVHRDEYRTQSSQLRQNVVDLVVCVCHFDRNLSQVVGMRARKDLLVMVQALGHCDQVVLDIGEIKPLAWFWSGVVKSKKNRTHNVRGRCHPPILVTSLRQPFDDIGFVAHES